jgi:hypothetical protein
MDHSITCQLIFDVNKLHILVLSQDLRYNGLILNWIHRTRRIYESSIGLCMVRIRQRILRFKDNSYLEQLHSFLADLHLFSVQ